MVLPQLWFCGPRSMVSRSMRLRPGYLAFRFSTTATYFCCHSSCVLYCQFTPVKITWSGSFERAAHGDCGASAQTSPLGSAHCSMKAWAFQRTCQRLLSRPCSKPELNQSPVTDTPMTSVQAYAEADAGAAAGTA